MTDLSALHAAVTAMGNASAQRNGIITLAGLRDALAALPAETPVVMDDGGSPAEIASYRGYYERLAIGTTRHRDDYATEVVRHMAHPRYDPDPDVAYVHIAEPVTAAEMVTALSLCDGLSFSGYKGGTYYMDGGTFMHAAEYGDCGLAVVGVRVEDGKAVIEAREYGI